MNTSMMGESPTADLSPAHFSVDGLTKPLTVWHIGGEDIHLRIPLLLALRQRGFNVAAVGSANCPLFTESDIPYFHYDLERGINPIADLRSQNQLFELMRRCQPDIVHGFDTKPSIFVPIVGKKAGILGKVRTITGMGYVFSSTSALALALRPIYQQLQCSASRAADMTVFQNSDDRDYFRQHQMSIAGQDDLILGSGIDPHQLIASRPSSEALAQLRTELGLDGQRVVTMISRLVHHKGVSEYLQAARMVQQTVDRVKFLLIGPLASEGKQAVSLREIQASSDCVQYLGSRKDIAALLALSDLFVLPSYYREGVPRVLLEAGAMGLPLITTRMPGCKEVVRDEWNGLLVAPRNVPELAAAVLKLLSSEADRTLMGQRSAAHIQAHFSLNQVANAYANLYHQVVGQLAPV